MIQETINQNIQRNLSKTAVKYENEILTYQQLIEQASILRSAIRKELGPKNTGIKIGLCIDKDVKLLSSVYSLIDSGFTYIPIDPVTPIERIKFIIDNCDMSLVITTDKYISIFKDILPVINLCDLPSAPDSVTTIESTSISKRDTAYIIYTSGTTGTPKGVPITYEAIENLLKGYGSQKNTGFSSSSVILQYASINFDSSIIDLFGTLFWGATMVIATEEERKDARQLCDLIVREGITYCVLPPSLVTILPTYDFPSMQSLVVAGEAMIPSIPAKVLGNGYKLFNGYGPTENTICSTIREITTDVNPLNIGHALPNTVCYVVNEDMKPVNIGEVGELLVGGIQLTTGYIHQKELNEQLFICNPFSDSFSIAPILYHTGDMVRLAEDNSFVFVGRKDSQVKWHGFRIELSEIKSQIEQCPQVLQSHVRLEDVGNDKAIVAYIKKKDGPLDIEALKKSLRKVLPTYMIPRYWAFVDNFELTINGKVDESKIHFQPIGDTQQILPSTQNEKLLYSVISHVTGWNNLSIDTPLVDEQGISSLQIMSIITELEFIGFQVSPNDFYQYQTIRGIAKNHTTRIGFWYNQPDKKKPTLLVISGYTSFIFLYPKWAEQIKDLYSIYVIESYHSSVYDVPRSLDDFIDEYMEIVSPIVEEYGMDVITGFCIGGEMGLPLAIRLEKKYHIKPHVVVMDGEIDRDRDTSKQIEVNVPTFTKEINVKRINQDMTLIKTMPADHYQGMVTSILSHEYNERLSFNENDIITERHKYWARQFFERGPAYWKKEYPDCILKFVECDHLDFLRDKRSIDPLVEYFRELVR